MLDVDKRDLWMRDLLAARVAHTLKLLRQHRVVHRSSHLLVGLAVRTNDGEQTSSNTVRYSAIALPDRAESRGRHRYQAGRMLLRTQQGLVIKCVSANSKPSSGAKTTKSWLRFRRHSARPMRTARSLEVGCSACDGVPDEEDLDFSGGVVPWRGAGRAHRTHRQASQF